MSYQKRLNNIGYMPVVESISRKFALRKEKVGNVPYRGNAYVKTSSGYMGGAVRKVRVNDQLINVNYFWMRKNARNTPLSTREHEIRQNFTICRASANATYHNLANLTKIQADFYGQTLANGYVGKRTRVGKWAGEYTTIDGWIFAIRMAQIAQGEKITAETDTWFND